MRYYEATTTISAPPEVVWSVLVATASWPSWDSGVDGVEGGVAHGARLKIRSQAAPGRAFPVKVTVLEPPVRLEFTGGMPLGLFRGVRNYVLASDGEGGTRFSVREEYSGPLLGLIWKSMPDLGPSFERFAGGLKAKAESTP